RCAAPRRAGGGRRAGLAAAARGRRAARRRQHRRRRPRARRALAQRQRVRAPRRGDEPPAVAAPARHRRALGDAMGFREITDVAVSGLLAQRQRMLVTASNLANAHTTRTPEGGPYQRRDPVFEARALGGPFATRLAER